MEDLPVAAHMPEPRPAAPRPRWHPLARAILYLVTYAAVQIGFSLLVGILALLVDERAARAGILGDEVLLLATALIAPVMVIVTWLFVQVLDRRTLASIGARWPEGGRAAALRQIFTAPLGTVAVLGLWLALILALPPALAAFRYRGLSGGYAAGPSWWPLPPWLLLVALFLGFLIQGGLEEWTIRGYIYRTLKDRWRPWVSALASSLLFALLHAGNPNVTAVALLNIVIAGMVLAALVERTGSLWSASLAHGTWNFAVACILSVPVSGVSIFHLLDVSISGDETLTGGSFGPEGSAVLTLIGLALMAFLWRGMWRRSPSGAPVPAPVSAPEDAQRPVSA
ncbi:MAG: CPBP family intramembrane glutamic endopeptidase [Thermoanaerobaculia bacterium]